MFGHGHSHGGGHGHSHGGGGHNHSHGNKIDVGFGDDDDIPNNKQNMMNQNMMMMKMMANAMKMAQSNSNGESNENNNMQMLPDSPQMSPQMMELAKKMFEQRQQLMKEYMDKDPKSNPAVLQEMMAKAAQAQAAAMAEFKALQQQQQQANITPSLINNDSNNIPQQIPIPGSNASNLLNANINSSKLDDLINNNNNASAIKKKNKEAEEALILDAISRKDYSQLNAVKATQYGVLDRLKELVESGQCDYNKPDNENVYLLHWAAINNRLDIAQYLISLRCDIDPIGGELESTPLNWAARSGHIQMVIFLMQNGANPTLYDLEGYSTIHLATMFGHSIVVAYLLAKGIDVRFKFYYLFIY
jgi:hypothetical protein